MAYIQGASGSFSFTDGYLTLRINWSETYDIAQNASILTIDGVDVKSTAMLGVWHPSLILQVEGQELGKMQYYAPATHRVAINAANTFYPVTAMSGAAFPWVSAPILHDELGQKTVTISVLCNPAGHNLSSIQIYRASDGQTRTFGPKQESVAELTAIPRASALEVGAGVLGQPQSLAVTRYFDGYTHTVTCTFGAESAVLCEDSTEETLLWTPPLAWARQLPNGVKASAKYTVETYGDGLIGTREFYADLSVPESLVPTVTATWEDTSGIPFGLTKLVSALSLTVEAAGSYGSTVTGTAVTLCGKPYSGGVLVEAGELPLTVTATDSRGRTGSASYTLSVADYAVPELTLSASRCQSDGTADDMGEFARVTVTGFVTQVEDANAAVLTLLCGTQTVEAGFDPGEVAYTAVVEAPSVSSMVISATLADRLTSTRREMILSVGYATLDLLAGGRGIAFGTTAKQEGFVCAMPAIFTGGIGGDVADYVRTLHRDGFTRRTWNSGDSQCSVPRPFFSGDDDTLLSWANSLMQAGFDGIAHVQLGSGATPTEYCMGLLVSNGSNRANILLLGLTALYCNTNYDGVWQGWRKVSTTAM